VATVDSDCSCAGDVLRTFYAKIEIVIPAGATVAERADFDDELQSLVLTTQWVNSVENLVQPSN
jgi:hypothetical protein